MPGRPASRIQIAEPATSRSASAASAASPTWRDTLRWQDAPDLLLPDEAALLARCGPDVIYEILTQQRVQAESGLPPENPLRVWRRGDGRNARIRIPKQALWNYIAREAGGAPNGVEP
jgi:hypothetical protein